MLKAVCAVVRWCVVASLPVVFLLLPHPALASGTIEVSSGCESCSVEELNDRVDEIIQEIGYGKCRWSDANTAPGAQPDDRGCWRTDSPAQVTNPGISIYLEATEVFKNCDENCGTDGPNPGPATVSKTLTVTIQGNKTITLGTKVSGGSSFLGIQAELNAALAAGQQVGCTSGLPHDSWAREMGYRASAN